MVLSPDDSKLVVLGTAYNGGSYSVNTMVFVVRPQDGGHLQDVLNLKLGNANFAEFRTFDTGLYYTDTGTVYMAFMQVSPTLQDTDDGTKTNMAGRMLVGSYNAATHSMNWLNEQALLGYSASLVYKNFCAGCGNIIVGGANFIQPNSF